MTKETTARRLTVAMGIAAGILVLESVGGLVTHSLALLSDAGHVLTDLLALGMTLFALRLAERRPTPARPSATTAWGFSWRSPTGSP